MKLIHKFTVELEKEVEKTSTKNENGQEITIKEKVREKVPVTIAMKKVSRGEQDSFRLFHGSQVNKAINAGLISKDVLLKKHIKEAGDLNSKETAELLAKKYTEVEKYQNLLVELGVVSENDTEKTEKQADILAKLLLAQQEIQAIESNNRALFENTAEAYAQERANLWLIFNQTYIQNGEKYDPLFKGSSFEEKESYHWDLEDKEDPLYVAARDKLAIYWGLYYQGQAQTPEDFARIDKRLKEQEDQLAKQKAEREAEKKLAEEKLKESAEKELVTVS